MAFLTPTIKIPSFIGVKLDDLFALSWFFVLLVLFKIREIKELIITTRLIYLLAFFIVLPLSISSGALIQLPTSLLDYTKFLWLIKITIVYLIFSNYIHTGNIADTPKKRDEILKHIVVAGFVSSLICFQQYFDLFSLNAIYTPIISPTQHFTLMPGYSSPRVIGMIGNPNAQGYALAVALLCAFYLTLSKQKSISILVPVCIFVALIMTLSRTALIIAFIGMATLTFLYSRGVVFTLYKIVLSTFLIALLVLLYVFLKDNEVIYKLVIFRLESLGSGVEENSFVARFHSWKVNYEYFLKSPYFGVGPLPRAEIFEAADNEWLLILRTYGLVGLIWFLLFLFHPIVQYKPSNNYQKNFRAFILSFCALTMFYMIPAAAFSNVALAPYIMMILALLDKPTAILKR
ncbi:O-antigen ligase family protein [Pseudoalteromonas spongiae]|uniref:O-antigen ligase family protein n=1 Tax=Pseudoalteromonas spongiae TaxID=298657 RepID=UPI00127A252F|nr:O-antigen ligase family protein [Pseudoalteromonas spongiae]TMO83617.1 hypothetical protein CWC15_14260 [Pseudoalteromonas spongiae]